MSSAKVWLVPDLPMTQENLPDEENIQEQRTHQNLQSSATISTDTRRSSLDPTLHHPEKGKSLQNPNRFSQHMEDIIDLYDLNEEERNHLERVLSREEEFGKFEDQRKNRLGAGLDALERSRPPAATQDGFCISCGSKLRILFNPAQSCVQCSRSTCKKCSRCFYRGELILCRMCHVRDLYIGKSGDWFVGFFGGFNSTKTLKRSASDVLKDSLRRSKNPNFNNSMRSSNTPVNSQLSASVKFDATDQARRKKSPPRKLKGSAQLQETQAKSLQEENQLNVEIDLHTSKTGQRYHPPELERIDRNAIYDKEPPKIQVTSSDQWNGSLLSLDETDESKDGFIQETNQTRLHAGTMPSNEFKQKAKSPKSSWSQNLGSSASLKNSKVSIHSSSASLYSTTSESYARDIQISGEIEMSVSYFPQVKVLVVHIQQCKDIASVNGGRKPPNPYVKMYILPDKTASGKRKTKIINSSNSPVYAADFSYDMDTELSKRTLWVSVWHNKRLGANTFLGEVYLPLEEVNQDSKLSWYTLNNKRFSASEDVALNNDDNHCPMIYRGDIVFAVKYSPPGSLTKEKMQTKEKSSKKEHDDGVLFVRIIEAKNLHGATKFVDPFVKVHLTPHKYQHGRKKTQVIRRSNNPEWGCTLDFHGVSPDIIQSMSLEITVWHHGRLSTNDFLGGIRLNSGTLTSGNASGNEVLMWTSMCSRPNEWIDGSLLLRPNMD